MVGSNHSDTYCIPAIDQLYIIFRVSGNRLLNWPKLLEVYANGFYSILVPEYVPYIIPHIFHIQIFIYSLKILFLRQLLISSTHQNSGTNCMINMARVRFAY